MDRERFVKLEKLLLGNNFLPSVPISIACDLFENGVTSAEWHEIGMRTLPDRTKVEPLFRNVMEAMRLNIYNHLRNLETGRDQPTAYRLRKSDDNYPF